MKDREKEDELIKKENNLIKAAKQFADRMEELSETYSEGDYTSFLIDEVAPIITEEDRLYSTSVFVKLEIAVILSRSELINRGNSMEEAIRGMNVNSMCWLIDHIYSMKKTLEALNPQNKDERRTWEGLKRDMEQLQEWILGDSFERLQEYEGEIKKLQNQNQQEVA